MFSDLNKFELVREIEPGVYLGRHPRMDRLVTLRTYSINSDPPSALSQLINTSSRLAKIDHPGLAHLYDVEINDRTLTLVMEAASGDSLRQVVRDRGILDAYTAALYARQAADALEHAHRLRLVHGRLGPEHLYVSEQRAVKIVGLGVPVDEEASLDVAKPDRIADVAALGRVLSFCLTGDSPTATGLSGSERDVDTDQMLALLRIARCADHPDTEDAIVTATEFKQALDNWIQRHWAARGMPWAAGAWSGESHPLDSTAGFKFANSDGSRSKLVLKVGAVVLLCLLILVGGLTYFYASTSINEQAAVGAGEAERSTTTPAGSTTPTRLAKPERRARTKNLPSLTQASVFHREQEAGTPERNTPVANGTSAPRREMNDANSGEMANEDVDRVAGDSQDTADEPSNTRRATGKSEEAAMVEEMVEHHPFRLLPQAVSLPNVVDDTPTTLGPLTPANRDSLSINLLGGDIATDAGRAFQIVRESEPRKWNIFLAAAQSAEEPSREIAEIWIAASELRFRWLAAAKGSRICPAVRNCLIQLESGARSHTIALRQPQAVDPMPVKKSVFRHRVDSAPDPQQLQFELLTSFGEMPQSESVVQASSGQITIGNSDVDYGVWIDIDVHWRRALEVTVSPWIRIEPGKKPQPMAGATVAKLSAMANSTRQQLLQLRTLMKSKMTQQQRAFLRGRISRQEAFLRQIDALREACQSISNRELQFRLFHQVGPHQVELLRTRDASELESDQG